VRQNRRSRPRRSKSGSLVSTLFVAVLLLAAAGGLAWWLDRTGTTSLGIIAERLDGPLLSRDLDLSIAAGDGWVTVPPQEGPVLVTADGAFRLRVDGEVYSFDAGEQVRIDAAPDLALQVRAARPPTVARVTAVE
jgi:hypothetical protein